MSEPPFCWCMEFATNQVLVDRAALEALDDAFEACDANPWSSSNHQRVIDAAAALLATRGRT